MTLDMDMETEASVDEDLEDIDEDDNDLGDGARQSKGCARCNGGLSL